MRIGLTFDLRDDYRTLGYDEEAIAEFDSNETIVAIESVLKKLGYQPERIGNVWQLTKALAGGKKWDLVFNIAEGMHGMAREAQVPALLEAWQIPYVFSSAANMVACHDKSLAKLVVSKAGIATAKWQVIKTLSDVQNINLPYPLFVKPIAEGTGKGISAKSLVKDINQLEYTAKTLLYKFTQPVLVETYLPGREFTIGIIGSGHKVESIGVMEIIAGPNAEKGGHTYHNKEYCEQLMTYNIVNDITAKKAEKLALLAWQALACNDAGRVDIRCDYKGKPYFLEANPLAGLHPTHSDLPMLAAKNGISYEKLLTRILDAAILRLALNKKTMEERCAS